MKFKQLLTKTLLVAVGLLAGQSVWGAFKHVIYANDYNEETSPVGWTGHADSNVALSTNQSYSSYGKFISGWPSGSGNRSMGGALSFTSTGYTTSTMETLGYVIEFDALLKSGKEKDRAQSQFIVGQTSHSTTSNAYQNPTDYLFSLSQPTNSTGDFDKNWYINDLENSTTSIATLEYNIFYHYKLVVTKSSVTYTISAENKDDIKGSKSLNFESVPLAKQIYVLLGRNSAWFLFDNIEIYDYMDAETVSDPTVAVTSVNGAKRTVTITGGSSSAGNDVTTYYTIDGSDPTSNSNSYSTPFDVSSACTVKAISISSEDVASNITSLAVTAGEVKLNTPTIKRTGANTYTISATATTTDGITADQTIHYTIGGGSEQTGTSLTDVDGDIIAWATATGFTPSDNANMAYVEAYELASEATWSYNLNSYPSAHTCTSIGDALSTTSKEIQSTTMYNLKEEDYPNLFVDNGGGWLLRNQANNAWKCQTASQSIGFDNVTTTDVIYIYAAKDKGGNSISSVTNGTVKYSYSDNHYYIVPTTDGSVKVTMNIGVSMNTVAVYKQVVSVTTTAAGKGWATLYTDKGLDFSNVDGLTAYTATIDNSTVKLNKVDDIQANTGVVLKSSTEDANTTYSIPVIASSSTEKGSMAGNATEGVALEENTAYILGINGSGNAQFFINSAGTIAAGKAYLPVGTNLAKALTVVFADDVTGIANVNAAEAVQPVKRIVKGQLVIEMNGKRYNAAGVEF